MDKQNVTAPLKQPTEILVGLDLARFSAAFMVMMFHYGFWIWATPDSSVARIYGNFVSFPEIAFLSSFGWIGVEIFFVLSGFLIASTANGASSYSFMRSRFLRLVPGAWLCATISALVMVAFNFMTIQQAIPPYLGTLAFLPKGPWVDGAYWTLDIEIMFYAVIFLLLCLNRFNRLVSVMAAIGCISTVFWILYTAFFYSGYTPLEGPYLITKIVHAAETRWSQLILIQHGCLFAIGTFLWLLLVHGAPKRYWWLVGFMSLGGVLEILHQSDFKAGITQLPTNPLIPMAVWLAAMAVIIITVKQNPKLTRICQRYSIPVRQLGLMTYPLYLLHSTIGVIIMRELIVFGMPRYATLMLTITIMFALSWWVSLRAEVMLQCLFRRGSDVLESILRRKWGDSSPLFRRTARI